MTFSLGAFRYFINNPSAWQNGFDEDISEEMRCAADEIDRLRAENKSLFDTATRHALEIMQLRAENERLEEVLNEFIAAADVARKLLGKPTEADGVRDKLHDRDSSWMETDALAGSER